MSFATHQDMESKMIQKKTNLTKSEVESKERSLKFDGYVKAFGSIEISLQPKEYLIAEDRAAFGGEKKYRIVWNEP